MLLKILLKRARLVKQTDSELLIKVDTGNRAVVELSTRYREDTPDIDRHKVFVGEHGKIK